MITVAEMPRKIVIKYENLGKHYPLLLPDIFRKMGKQ